MLRNQRHAVGIGAVPHAGDGDSPAGSGIISGMAGEGAEDAIVQERSCRRTKKILGQPSVLTAVEGSGLQGLNPDR